MICKPFLCSSKVVQENFRQGPAGEMDIYDAWPNQTNSSSRLLTMAWDEMRFEKIATNERKKEIGKSKPKTSNKFSQHTQKK